MRSPPRSTLLPFVHSPPHRVRRPRPAAPGELEQVAVHGQIDPRLSSSISLMSGCSRSLSPPSVLHTCSCTPNDIGHQVDVIRLVPFLATQSPGAGCALLADGITALLVALLEGGDAVGSGHAGLYPPYMAVINRLALIHPQHFGAMVTSVSTARGADVMPPLLDLWIDKFDVVSEPGWRKLSVLAMVQCIGTEAFDVTPPLPTHFPPQSVDVLLHVS